MGLRCSSAGRVLRNLEFSSLHCINSGMGAQALIKALGKQRQKAQKVIVSLLATERAKDRGWKDCSGVKNLTVHAEAWIQFPAYRWLLTVQGSGIFFLTPLAPGFQ